ncbi:hypothetical protein RRG08_029944 [Elysia crispata]|uniref:Uncharacterized protein n=1 Tax=Elysia crispata TaxID=231223 RepID=A0AAE0ZIW2_9GAST|nr:hypothetical protein RRG08_029944 [Elysia crispata]
MNAERSWHKFDFVNGEVSSIKTFKFNIRNPKQTRREGFDVDNLASKYSNSNCQLKSVHNDDIHQDHLEHPEKIRPKISSIHAVLNLRRARERSIPGLLIFLVSLVQS